VLLDCRSSRSAMFHNIVLDSEKFESICLKGRIVPSYSSIELSSEVYTSYRLYNYVYKEQKTNKTIYNKR
jgi:hypothetical protein